MDLTPIVFYVFSGILILMSLAVILVTSPIYSALFLALSMLTLAVLFFVLEAYFLAGVQLIVYAGAVVVLFVMVLMMFDLRREQKAFSGNLPSVLLKMALSILGLVVLISPLSLFALKTNPEWLSNKAQITERLAENLFTKHLFTFEVMGVLLTVVLIGAATIAKAKGGTHARHE